MAGRVVTAGGVLLAAVIAAATWLYVSGQAPPPPLNAWAFHGALLLCTAYALLFGRASSP